MLRLHPLSAAELGLGTPGDLEQLLTLGGFPEPFLGDSEVEARRWSRECRNLIIREELTSLERVQDLGNLELLVLRLPELVGSPLSVNALREDLQLSHKTVESWIGILERLYTVFRLPPFGAPGIRAIKKARKHYHLDWSLVPDAAARFENLVAAHLLKWVHFRQDTEGLDLELRYFRDSDGREVDFVVVDRGAPVLLVECKLADAKVDRSLRYLKLRFPECPAWQISASGSNDVLTPEGIRICPALTLLRTLV
jgi:predicted AAA+ superfamily ATPase